LVKTVECVADVFDDVVGGVFGVGELDEVAGMEIGVAIVDAGFHVGSVADGEDEIGVRLR